MKFKNLNESSKLYLFLTCDDGTFVGCGKSGELWNFAHDKLQKFCMDRTSMYYMRIKYSDGEKVILDNQAKLFSLLRDFDSSKVLNRINQTIQRNKDIYIECVLDTISFRIGKAEDFNIFNEEDSPENIEKIAPNKGIKKLDGFWYDQII